MLPSARGKIQFVLSKANNSYLTFVEKKKKREIIEEMYIVLDMPLQQREFLLFYLEDICMILKLCKQTAQLFA